MSSPQHLPIDGMTVTRIAVDDSLTLACRSGDGRSADIRIDSGFHFRTAGGEETAGCVEERPSSAGPLLDLVLVRIRAARIDDRGNLVIDFGDGSSLTAEAEDHFVSWEIGCSNGFRAVCLADRDVVIKGLA